MTFTIFVAAAGSFIATVMYTGNEFPIFAFQKEEEILSIIQLLGSNLRKCRILILKITRRYYWIKITISANNPIPS